MPIKISQQFDAGAIEVLSTDAPDTIMLNLRQDSHAAFSQWFYFRLQGARDTACTMRFMNAGHATYLMAGRITRRLPVMTAKPGFAYQRRLRGR